MFSADLLQQYYICAPPTVQVDSTFLCVELGCACIHLKYDGVQGCVIYGNIVHLQIVLLELLIGALLCVPFMAVYVRQ